MSDSSEFDGEKQLSGPSPLLAIVANRKSVERLLKRAADQAARDANRRMKGAGRINHFKHLGKSTAGSFEAGFARALENAVKHHANNSGPKPSIRMRAPDTGGRSFHFAYSTVSAPGSTSKRKAGTATAHMDYIDRDDALERANAALERAADEELGIDRPAARLNVAEELGRDPSSMMQGYIEDEAKVETFRGIDVPEAGPLQTVAFSFGNADPLRNMGETREERREFWDLVEKHPGRVNARLQSRMILQLPMEASPAQRLEIVKKFTEGLEARGLPFWAALHAPTEKNDPRNFHAHIVFIERPAKKVMHAADGVDDGTSKPQKLTWDFAAVKLEPTKGSEPKPLYPHRQKKDRKSNDRNFVFDERKRFAETVNAVMSAGGSDVRYDPRSYGAMGLEVTAMTSISRRASEAVKSGERLAIDAGQTERQIQAEFDRFTRERAPDFVAISKVKAAVRAGERELRALERSGAFIRRKPVLVAASHSLKIAIRKAALSYARAREAHVERRIKQAYEVRSIERIIEATDSKKIGALHASLRRRLDNANREGRSVEAGRLQTEIEAVPDAYMAKILRDAAQAELELVMAEQQQKTDISFQRVREALCRWTRHASGEAAPVLPEVVPTVTVAGIKAPQPEPAPPETPKQPARPMFTGVESVIDQIFNTPQSQVMLKLYQRFGEYITDNAEPDVPGRTALDLAKNLVEAVKVHPLKAEQLMFDAKYGAAAPKVSGIGTDGEPVSAPVAPLPKPPASRSPGSFTRLPDRTGSTDTLPETSSKTRELRTEATSAPLAEPDIFNAAEGEREALLRKKKRRLGSRRALLIKARDFSR